MRPRLVALVAAAAILPAIADAQALGTFTWGMEPYCDVLTLDVIEEGNVFRLQGTDDWCGAGPLPVRGTAVLGADGRAYLGLTITPREIAYANQPETEGMFVSAVLDLSTLEGPWRDNLGDAGTFRRGRRAGANPRLLGRSTSLHTAVKENTTKNMTCLPIGDPDAMLLVQYNRRASAIGPNLNMTFSVFYADEGTGLSTPGLTGNVWCIKLDDPNATMPLDASFTVRVFR